MRKGKPMRLKNKEPKTWLCECGQVNIAPPHDCFACGESRYDCEDKGQMERGRGPYAFNNPGL